jgi:hypothetical protein
MYVAVKAVMQETSLSSSLLQFSTTLYSYQLIRYTRCWLMPTIRQSAVSISTERVYISDTPVVKFKIAVADSIISIVLKHIDSACNSILFNNTNIKEALRRTAFFPLKWHRPNRKRRFRHMRPTILVLLHLFFAAGTCLSSRCLATKGRMNFTKPTHSNVRRVTHADTLLGWIYEVLRWNGLRRHEYIPSFINIGSGIQKLMGRGEGSQTAWRLHSLWQVHYVSFKWLIPSPAPASDLKWLSLKMPRKKWSPYDTHDSSPHHSLCICL